MERLVTVKDVRERYGCSLPTARKYLRQMPHYENPLAAPVWAFEEWERGREVTPAKTVFQKRPERTIVPRKREDIIGVITTPAAVEHAVIVIDKATFPPAR